MDTQTLDIYYLIEHILNEPNTKHPSKHFAIGAYLSEYGDTNIRPNAKEHKLWTPRKDRKHRCFLMIQLMKNNCFRIHHVLNDAAKWLKMREYTTLNLYPPKTFATERGEKDQFEGIIEICLSGVNDEKASLNNDHRIKELIKLIMDITDETVTRRLNLRSEI